VLGKLLRIINNFKNSKWKLTGTGNVVIAADGTETKTNGAGIIITGNGSSIYSIALLSHAKLMEVKQKLTFRI
jgi:hypothetical protein